MSDLPSVRDDLRRELLPESSLGEPDLDVWRDDRTGLVCAAIRHPDMGFCCGYVAVNPGHPLYGRRSDDADPALDVDVHGGITFSGERGQHNGLWWFGFDCGHAFDLIPAFLGLFGVGHGDQYRDLAYVHSECAKLARAIAGYQARIRG